MNGNDLFGELRSLISSKGIQSSEMLLTLLKRAYHIDPYIYKDVWIPYLLELELPSFHANSVSSLEEIAPLVAGNDFYVKVSVDDVANNILRLKSHFDKITHLTIRSYSQLKGMSIGSIDFMSMFLENDLSKIKSVNIVGMNLGRYFWSDFFALEFKGLNVLRLVNNNIDEKAFEVFSNSRGFENLVCLDVRHNRIKNRGLNYIANNNRLRLKGLFLGGNSFSINGLKDLVDSHVLNDVEFLDLSQSNISVEELSVLFDSSVVGNVQWLELMGNDITEQIFDMLLGRCLRVCRIGLSYNNIENLDNLCRLVERESLEYVNLKHNPLGSNSLGILNRMVLSGKLKCFELSNYEQDFSSIGDYQISIRNRLEFS